jgi:hypothetical protein
MEALILFSLLIAFLFWRQLLNLFLFLFISKKEIIKGKVVAFRKKIAPAIQMPTYVNLVDNNIGYNGYPFFQEPIFVTNYFLRIKNGVQWYTVRVTEDLFEKMKKEVKGGLNTVSLLCEKCNIENIYELVSS